MISSICIHLLVYILCRESPKKFLNKVQDIHYDRKADDEDEPHEVDKAFRFSVYRFFPYPLDEAENYPRSVERGDGKKIENGEVDADKRHYLERVNEPV